MPNAVSKPTHVGARHGAGRKPTYGEPTRTVRVPISLVAEIATLLDERRQQPNHNPSSSLLRPVAVSQTAVSVALLGRSVYAGVPASGDDYIEDAVDLRRHLARNPASTFVMTVRGWSMKNAGIADGDEVVVHRSLSPSDGKVVVADVDGEVTVKRLKRQGRGWLLQADNPESADVEVAQTSTLNIWGVVTHVIRKL